MANIVYRGSSAPTAANTAANKGAALTNDEIDKNFFALNDASITIGTTAIKLSGTSTSLTGLSSIGVIDLTVGGNLTVNGTTTTINSSTLTTDDKNIELGVAVALSGLSGTVVTSAVTSAVTMTSTSGLIPGMLLTKASGAGAFGTTATIASIDSATQITITATTANTFGAIVFNAGGVTDATANGGGITLKGTTDKTLIWDNTNSNWTSSENFNIATNKVFKIANTSVLSSDTLGSGVTKSSLTKLGLTVAGFVKTDASGNLSSDTTAYLSSISGDITTSGSVATLAVSGVTAGTYGSTTAIPSITVDTKGRITSVSTNSINAVNYIGTTTTQASSANQALTGITSITLPGSTSGSVQIIPTAIAGTDTALTLPATSGTIVVKDASGNFSAGTITAALTGNASTATKLATARKITVGGTGSDATWEVSFDGSADATAALTLAASGVTAGSYGTASAIPAITVDSKGRITSINTVSIGTYTQYTGTTGPTWGSNYSTISSSGISEIGRYIHFHGASADAVDYTVRLDGGGAGSSTLTLTGSFSASGDITATSDARTKTNVQTVENALEKTLQLRGVTYEKDGKSGIGVIAQEIRKVLPQVVVEASDEEKTLSVAYGNIVGLLVEAIKELNVKVEDLKNQLANK